MGMPRERWIALKARWDRQRATQPLGRHLEHLADRTTLSLNASKVLLTSCGEPPAGNKEDDQGCLQDVLL